MLKTVIATLVLASAVLGAATQSYAGPEKGASAPTGEINYQDRASKNWDGGGY